MKIAFTDIDHVNLDIEYGVFHKAGYEPVVFHCRTEDDVINNCKGYGVLINQYAPITARVMDALPEFKMVVRYGVGVDNIDVKAAVERGITVCNIPDYGTNEVADQALALMMALVRKVVIMNRHTKEVGWDCPFCFPITRLSEQTVGILGFGRIGQAFAKRCHSLGCSIIACDHHLEPGELHSCGYVVGVSLEELVERSDIISIHCPPIKGKYIFDAEMISKMKDGVYIVNVARGGIIDEDALKSALESGKVAGAAIDCYKREPMPVGDDLFQYETFIASPHMAWYSVQASADLKRKVAEQAVKFAETGKVDYPVYKN